MDIYHFGANFMMRISLPLPYFAIRTKGTKTRKQTASDIELSGYSSL